MSMTQLADNVLLARMATSAPRVPWDVFYTTIFDPIPKEHIAIIGPTGNGKTVLQNAILPKFPFVTIFVTKPQDEIMQELVDSKQYVKMRQWHKLSPTEVPRRVLWPDASDINAEARQREVFKYAMAAIFREAGRPKKKPVGWALAIDELWYIVNVLGLDREVKMFLLQGRSLGHSLIVATQRPSSVPLEVYDQSTHLFFFADNDRANLDRLAGINARSSSMVRLLVSNLERHQVLYINTRTRDMYRTKLPPYLAG